MESHLKPISVTDLHGYWEIILSLGREEDIDCFLGVGLVASGWCTHFNDVQLENGNICECMIDKQHREKVPQN